MVFDRGFARYFWHSCSSGKVRKSRKGLTGEKYQVCGLHAKLGAADSRFHLQWRCTVDQQQELILLVRDLIETTHGLASSLEKIVTSFEQLSGRIAEERELSVVTSQFAGLHHRAEELLEGISQRSWEPSKNLPG
jgi:hypothetical protein